MADTQDKPKPRATPDNGLGNIAPGELLFADMKRRTDQLKAELLPIMDDAQNFIDEEAFKHYFLPLFAGELSKPQARQALNAWYQVAGNPYTAVDVIRGDQKVATVPPIRTNILTGKPSEEFKDVGTVFEDAAHHATISPKGAQAMIVTALHQRYMVDIPRPDLTREQRAWFDLLNFYGKAPKSFTAGKAAPGAKAAAADDDFDYE